MNPRPYVLREANWKTVSATEYEVAVLPWGATEAHNYHLPYATDVIQSDYIAERAAGEAWHAGARAVALPCVPYGVNTGQLDIRLDLNMSPSTQFQVLRDITQSLNRQGIPKLVVLNGHGGNDFRQMIRELSVEFDRPFVCTLSWYNILDLVEYFDEPGDHGGEMETSNMMFIAPDLVLPLNHAGEGVARSFRVRALREGWAWAPRSWSKATVDTGVGNPALASADKGERYLDAVCSKIASFLIELADADLDDLYE
jgi:creatinine amidohydrolase